MITLNNISKTFLNQVHALSEVSFEILDGQVIYILGESGSGKSTLLRIIAGLEDASQGTVLVNQEEITGPSQNLVPGYDTIAYVPQDFKLQQFWTVRDNLGKKISHYPTNEKEQRIEELLRLCQLESYAERFPRELSGGQQQRIAIAAAIADEPEVVLLDEPFSNLDLPMKMEVRKEVIDILRAQDITVLLVSHDPAEALAVAEQIIILNNGIIEQKGTPQDLYNHPVSAYSAKFLGPINQISINKNMEYIRPENFVLKETGEWKGSVTDSSFAGMHYLTTIKLAEHPHSLLIYTREKKQKGEKLRFDIIR